MNSMHHMRTDEGFPATDRATALATSGDDFGRILEFSGLRIVREERGEVFSATASAPLPVGSTVTLGFGQPGRRASFGTVEACQGGDRRWRMQVRIDRAVAG
jgi:hypothetical protein